MKTYTVVLLYPDYLTGDYGADLFVESTAADDPAHAVSIIQKRASRAIEREIGVAPDDPEDFKMILLLAGDCEVLGDATGIYS